MEFTQDLLTWYANNKRNLPWRQTTDPYKIWLSEIMLQQTQVDTVIDYYLEFINRYPTVESLADADQQDVLKLWEGLGYYSRAKRLIPCAQQLVNEFNGNFPQDYKDALTLPGVGPYTAGAVLSIAYNIKVAAVDGNVKRVYARLYNLKWDITAYGAKKKFKALVEETLPDNRRDFNQSLMELGALICRPKNPDCQACPIQKHCEAYAQGTQDALPIKKKKIKQTKEQLTVLVFQYKNEVFVEKRPSTGLLANMYGFITVEALEPNEKSINQYLLNFDDLSIDTIDFVKKTKHVFTHKIWEMDVFKVHLNTKTTIKEGQWITPEHHPEYPIPKAFNKLFKWL